MPAKELKQPCMECNDVEFEVTVRQRNLCKYETIYSPSNRDSLTFLALAISDLLAIKF